MVNSSLIGRMQSARVIALDGLTVRLRDAITARFGDVRLVDALPLFAAGPGAASEG